MKGRNNRGIVEESKKNTCLFFLLGRVFVFPFTLDRYLVISLLEIQSVHDKKI